MGAPPEVVARLRASEAGDFEVWQANWDTVNAFVSVCTQWRTVAIGGGMEAARVYWSGLDYAGVAAGLAGAGIAATPEIWAGLRIMEGAARNTLNGVEESD